MGAAIRLEALLFDVDGTLADTEALGHLPAYNEAFAELGLPWEWSPQIYREDLLLQPGGQERIRHYVLSHKPQLGEHAEDAGRNLAAWVNRVHAAKSRIFRRRVEQGHVPLRPGVARLIREAAQGGVRVGLVTNASRRSLEPLLAHCLGEELLGRLDCIVSGEEVKRKKPAPDLYLRALERLNLSPTKAVAVEDSAMGLGAAHAAGLATLITLNDDTRGQAFGLAAAVCDSLGEPDAPWRAQGCGMEEFSHATPSALATLLRRYHAGRAAPEGGA